MTKTSHMILYVIFHSNICTIYKHLLSGKSYTLFESHYLPPSVFGHGICRQLFDIY